jgi:hypothetical protein
MLDDATDASVFSSAAYRSSISRKRWPAIQARKLRASRWSVRPDTDGVLRPARPEGSAVTSNVRYAVISGGARTTFEPSGTVWTIDLRSRKVVATMTGIGNDPYGLAVVEVDRDHHHHGNDRD